MKILIIIDLINEFLHKDGKLSQRGYVDFAISQNSILNINQTITKFKSNIDNKIIFCNLAFDYDYKNLFKESKLFGAVEKNQILKIDSWSSSIFKNILVPENSMIIAKSTISGYDSLQDLINPKDEIFLMGLSTDLGVLSTAFDLHNHGFNVQIVDSCCIASSILEHSNGISILNKFCSTISDFY
jgi:ureidoacrylate peracid hydrolase